MLRAEKLTPGPIGVGTRFRDLVASMGRPAEIAIEIIDYERPRRLTESIRLSTMDIGGGSGSTRFPGDPDAVVMGVDASRCFQADDPGWWLASAGVGSSGSWASLKRVMEAQEARSSTAGQ